MNAHQRKKLATARHYHMPLGCEVKVRDGARVFFGTMGKHDSSGRCIVHFDEHNELSRAANDLARQPFAWVSYYNVRPTAVHRRRPWWRLLRERQAA